MKILNLYSCLGGNRKLWGDNHEITAVELDAELAKIYQKMFPKDTVIVADAHQYLLEHYKEFDFIWSSPPCPTHSRFQYAMKSKRKMKYPDMKLYQEILLLNNFFKGKYCIENVIPFYKPLIPAKKRGRHLFWTNFNLPNILSDRKGILMASKNEIKQWEQFHEINISEYKGNQRKDKICRNLVDYEAGKTILDTVLKIKRKENILQTKLF